MKNKRFHWLFPIFVILLLFAMLIPASAEIYFSKDNRGDSQSVFIAGNPDLYPIEYFNPETEQYEGVMPLLFERISQATGIHFTYIYATPENKQQYLAQNRQVDIVSAYVTGGNTTEYIPTDSALLSFSYNGQTETVTIGFTSVCDESVKESILSYLNAMTSEELTSLTVSYVMTHEKQTSGVNWIWIAVIAAALICIVLLLFLLHRNRKQQREQQKFHPISGFYNKSYLNLILDSLIHDFVRKRYYAVCISVNYGNLLKYYGKEAATALEDYVISALRLENGEREFCVHVDDDLSFLWLMQAPNGEQAELRVFELIRKLNQENGILNADYRVTISAGCYGLKQTHESGERILEIVTEAYNHAESHALPYYFVDSAFIKMVDRKARLQKETVQAVKKGQFLFYLQYIVDIQTNRIVGAEGLSRWEHPREGLLFPSAYIQLMQQAKNIHLLDFYMLEKSCQQLERWNTEETRHLIISCNFDRLTVARDDFYDRVMEITDKYAIDRNRLILEITEETFTYDKENVIRNTERLRAQSFRMALDDFGSGSTSFQNLIEYHISHLKMDRIFVGMMQNEQGKTLIRGIIAASHTLGLPVLQEGVETYEELQRCKELGIDLIQGFVFSRVIPSIEGDRVRRRLAARLAEGLPQNDLQTYADVNPDAPEDNVYEDDEEGNAFGTRYRWSFTARLHRAPEEVAAYYSELKNAFLKYKKVRSRISWSYDTISYKHAPVAKMVMRQKSLLLYLALPPSEFEDSKYFFVDASEKKKYEQVPMRLKIRGIRGFKHALELVEEIAGRLEWKENQNYVAQDHTLPQKSVEELINLRLIKINDKAIPTEELPAQITPSEGSQRALAFEISSNVSIVQSITEELSTEEPNMEDNISITDSTAEIIAGSYYRWSFTARLHQAPENVAAYYSEIKNTLLRYKKVKSRISWSCDTVTFGKEQLAKFVLTPKTLYVYLALSPKEFEGTKYFFTDESETKKYERVPMRIRVRSERGMKYTIELIEKLAEQKELQFAKNFEAADYTLPFETMETLLDLQLIKKIDILEQLAQPEEVLEEVPEEAVAAAVVVEEPVAEVAPVEEPVAEEPIAEEPIAEEPAPAPAVTEMEQTPAEEIQNASLIEAETIHVAFLQKICQQFDADELNAHVKVVYKKKREKKTSIFDIVMRKNRS